MTNSEKSDSAKAIAPVLNEAEAELSRHLQAACEAEAQDVSRETNAELMRLEDELLAAVRSVEHTVALRRVIERSSPSDPSCEPVPTGDGSAEEAPCLVREFADRTGRPWRVWRVIPGRARAKVDRDRVLGVYAAGWLAFEALDDGTRRRLLERTDDWMQRPDEALVELLERSTRVPQYLAAQVPAPEGTPAPEGGRATG